MWALMENPEQYKELRNDLDSTLDRAIEEILRWATPVYHFRRTATVDTEFRGKEIKQGDKVVIWHTSADRDEEVFDDPFTFDITRWPNEHIAFGGGGAHFCLGANLARMELRADLPGDPRAHPRHAPDRRAVACCAPTSSAASSTCR